MLEQSLAHWDWEQGMTKHDWYLNKTTGCQISNCASIRSYLLEAVMISQQVLYLGEDLLG